MVHHQAAPTAVGLPIVIKPLILFEGVWFHGQEPKPNGGEKEGEHKKDQGGDQQDPLGGG
jgi:hypothetical protein